MEFSHHPVSHQAVVASSSHAGFLTAVAADSHQQFYGQYQQQQPQHQLSPRRLPSVSELLVTSPPQSQHHHQQHLSSYAVVDARSIPGGAMAVDYSAQQPPPASRHRDSESASSVSSQVTLLDSYTPPSHHAFKSVHPSSISSTNTSRSAQAMAENDQEEVYAAASILMSLRAYKMPC